MWWAESAPLVGTRLTDLAKVGDASGTPGTHGSGIPEQGQQPYQSDGELPIAAPASGTRRAPRPAAMTARRSLVIPVRDVCAPPQLNTASHQFSSNSSDLIATASINNVGRCGL